MVDDARRHATKGLAGSHNSWVRAPSNTEGPTMNLIHRIYCRSERWRAHLSQLLPWATEGVPLRGANTLELGSGPGLTTYWLRSQTEMLTAIEFDKADAYSLKRRLTDVDVRHGDAAALPFPDASFDVVVRFTMLHHVPTVVRQNEVLTEARRVLRPGGTFAGSDSRWGALFALAHLGDTLCLIDPHTFADRLHSAHFTDITTGLRREAFRFRAIAA